MAKIVVTGASGKAGRAAVRDLTEHGHEVVPIDLVASPDREVRVLVTDLTDYGQAIDALHGAEAVVHLANIPADRLRPPVTTFNVNVVMNFNVFHAAARLGLSRGEVSEFGSLMSGRLAREALGFEPQHTWRGEVLRDR